MIQPLQLNNFRPQKKDIDPKVHETQEAKELKEACQQFESILWAKLWKEMRNSARELTSSQNGRPWAQMEDLSLEMSSEDLVTSSGGAGLWRSLYDSMIGNIAAKQDTEARLSRAKGDWEAAIAGVNLTGDDSDSDAEPESEPNGLESGQMSLDMRG